jgi:hypothetical protein
MRLHLVARTRYNLKDVVKKLCVWLVHIQHVSNALQLLQEDHGNVIGRGNVYGGWFIHASKLPAGVLDSKCNFRES